MVDSFPWSVAENVVLRGWLGWERSSTAIFFTLLFVSEGDGQHMATGRTLNLSPWTLPGACSGTEAAP